MHNTRDGQLLDAVDVVFHVALCFSGGMKINIYPPKMTKKQAGDKEDLGITKKGMKEQTLEPPPSPPCSCPE